MARFKRFKLNVPQLPNSDGAVVSLLPQPNMEQNSCMETNKGDDFLLDGSYHIISPTEAALSSSLPDTSTEVAKVDTDTYEGEDVSGPNFHTLSPTGIALPASPTGILTEKVEAITGISAGHGDIHQESYHVQSSTCIALSNDVPSKAHHISKNAFDVRSQTSTLMHAESDTYPGTVLPRPLTGASAEGTKPDKDVVEDMDDASSTTLTIPAPSFIHGGRHHRTGGVGFLGLSRLTRNTIYRMIIDRENEKQYRFLNEAAEVSTGVWLHWRDKIPTQKPALRRVCRQIHLELRQEFNRVPRIYYPDIKDWDLIELDELAQTKRSLIAPTGPGNLKQFSMFWTYTAELKTEDHKVRLARHVILAEVFVDHGIINIRTSPLAEMEDPFYDNIFLRRLLWFSKITSDAPITQLPKMKGSSKRWSNTEVVVDDVLDELKKIHRLLWREDKSS